MGGAPVDIPTSWTDARPRSKRDWSPWTSPILAYPKTSACSGTTLGVFKAKLHACKSGTQIVADIMRIRSQFGKKYVALRIDCDSSRQPLSQDLPSRAKAENSRKNVPIAFCSFSSDPSRKDRWHLHIHDLAQAWVSDSILCTWLEYLRVAWDAFIGSDWDKLPVVGAANFRRSGAVPSDFVTVLLIAMAKSIRLWICWSAWETLSSKVLSICVESSTEDWIWVERDLQSVRRKHDKKKNHHYTN